MDVSLAVRQRLNKLGLEQRELAIAAQVTESYWQSLHKLRSPTFPSC
jgi:predicted transcriptional regulator